MLNTSRAQRNNLLLAKVMVICKISNLGAWPSLRLHVDAQIKSYNSCILIFTDYHSYVYVGLLWCMLCNVNLCYIMVLLCYDIMIDVVMTEMLCVCVCVCVYMHACVCACVWACMPACICVCVCACPHVRGCIRA